MFTGIVAAVAAVESVSSAAGGGSRLRVVRPDSWTDVATGESVAVSGVCLTVLPERASGGFLAFDVSPETLRRSTLAALRTGATVNLERALAAGDRLGGHVVSGHVDATTAVVRVSEDGAFRTMTFRLDDGFGRYVVEKGSIALDGVSLTVAALRDEDFDVALVPHTWESTTLGTRRAGDRVNVEVDVLGKYVERILGLDRDTARDARLARLLAP